MPLRTIVAQRSDLWWALQLSKSRVSMREPKIARNPDRRNHLKDLGVYGRIILKCRLSFVIFRLRIGPENTA
jgi:hypothetical protein